MNPPDTVGDVGKDFYIQAINDASGTRYAVYQKSDGALVAGPFLLSSLGGPAGRGDPIVLYDHLAERWLLSEFAATGNVLSIYISRTDNPITGGWFNYQFTTPNFPDYPKYGVWPDAYYVTSNEDDGPAVYALDRAKMLAGDPATMQRFLASQLMGFGFQSLTPADVDGPGPPAGSPHYVLRHRDDEAHNVGANDPSQDFLDIYEVHIDWSNPASSSLTGPIGIPVAEFDSDLSGLLSFACFPQQGSSIRLDPLREVIMWRVQYRNFGTHETMVGSFVTDVDGSDHGGVRWFELRKASGGSWHVHQEGTYAPDSHNRWMSSIAMDGSGNIALAYNVSSTTLFPGLRYAGRLASDAMGTMPHGEHVLIDVHAANASNRYGDYTSLNVDPVSDEVFWYTGQYNQAANWSTRFGAFRFATSDETSPIETGGRMGFVWADDQTAGSYTPHASYAYNSSGGAIGVTRSDVGTYAVTFDGLGGNGTPGGHVQVTAYGTDSHAAKVQRWNSFGSDFIVHVLCFDASGAPADSRYTVLVQWPPTADGASSGTSSPPSDPMELDGDGGHATGGGGGGEMVIPCLPPATSPSDELDDSCLELRVCQYRRYDTTLAGGVNRRFGQKINDSGPEGRHTAALCRPCGPRAFARFAIGGLHRRLRL